MSVKSVLSKIGKVALTAAPYVAAPFTGGASLALTGLANKGVQKWSEHDAKAAEAKGLAPSNFDKVLGKVGGYAGLASMAIPGGALGSIGMLGKAAQTAGKVGQVANVASKAGKVADIVGKVNKGVSVVTPVLSSIAAARNQSSPTSQSSPIGPSANIGPSTGVGPGAVPRVSTAGNAPGFNYGSNNPNLADSIAAGRGMAVKNQQFRSGYDITAPNFTDSTLPPEVIAKMPRIFSNVDRGNLKNKRRQAAY
jgi:hypothetical protein